MKTITATLTICLAAATLTAAALFIPGRDQAATTSGDTGTIDIAGFAFAGAGAATPGSTITVTNNDSAPHTLTARDGSFDTGVLEPGTSIEMVVGLDAGTVDYLCEIHPSMTGRLEVAP